jgi:hypothetical protein
MEPINEKVNDDVCSICLEKPQTRVNLSCNHKFCYLCLKETVKHGGNVCPMCRADIPQDFAENAAESIENMNDVNYIYPFRWAYSGRTDGWWFYQEDHNDIIEKAWQEFKKDGYSHVIITVCSTNYTIDFSVMLQIHGGLHGVMNLGYCPTARKIKRMENVMLTHTKGVAGLRYVPKEKLPKNRIEVTYKNDITTSSHNYFNPNNVIVYLNDSSSSDDEDSEPQ